MTVWLTATGDGDKMMRFCPAFHAVQFMKEVCVTHIHQYMINRKTVLYNSVMTRCDSALNCAVTHSTDFILYHLSGLFSTRVVWTGCKRSTAKSRNNLKTIWNGLNCHQQKGDFKDILISHILAKTKFYNWLVSGVQTAETVTLIHVFLPNTWTRVQVSFYVT